MAPRYSDQWKKQNGIPAFKKANGHHPKLSPEDAAARVLAEAPNVEQAIARAEHARMFGIPKAEMHKPETTKRRPTEHALRLAKMLLDDRYGRRR